MAVMSTAMSTDGVAARNSMVLRRRLSRGLPEIAAANPAAMPAAAAAAAAMPAASRVLRAPNTTLAKMSRPKSSVPMMKRLKPVSKLKLSDGGMKYSEMFCL